MASIELKKSAESIEGEVSNLHMGINEIIEYLEKLHPTAKLEAAANIKEYMALADSIFNKLGMLARSIVEEE